MQKARTPYNYNVEYAVNKAVKTWCCCPKGNVDFKCTFEKDVVRIDESVMMRFSIDSTNFGTAISNIR